MKNPASRNAAKEKWVAVDTKIKPFLLFSIFLTFVFLSGVSFGSPENQANGFSSNDRAVSKKILDNGLVVLVEEMPSKGLATVDVKVRAGSSLEEEYLGSGISHLVEHMLFKGTKKRKVGDIEKEAKSYGGFVNGAVSYDMAEYVITLPSENTAKAVDILKDMLLNASFDKLEFEKEKSVILDEINLNEDEPQSKLLTLLNETAYIYHPYKYPPIGYREKFISLTRDDALKYYNRMYAPNRMVVSVAGDVKSGEIFAMIESAFKDFRPPNYRIIGLNPVEPAQIVRRSASAEKEITLSYLAMGFHSSSILDEDLFAMDVLASILGRHDTSRLKSTLVKDKRLAYSVSCWNFTPKDPGMFVVTVILDKANIDQAEKEILAQIEKIKTADITKEELESARRMALSDFIFSHQTTDSLASTISSDYLLTGSPVFSKRYVENINKVSIDDIKRVASKYLRQDNLTTAIVVPPPGAKTGESKPVVETEDVIKKITLPNGLRVLLREDNRSPAVAVTVAILGGLMVEDETDNGIANLTTNMLLKGAGKFTEEKIRGAIESRGGFITPFSGFNSFGFNLRFLKEDLESNLTILKAMLTEPLFPEEELEKEKAQVVAMIKDEEDDIFHKGFNLLRKEIYAGTPYSFSYFGTVDSVKRLKREDLVNYFNTYCFARNIVISISGDFKAVEVEKVVNSLFSDLNSRAGTINIPKAAALRKPVVNEITMDREQAMFILGFQTEGVFDNDRYVIEVLTSVMSGSSGRLFAKLRDKDHLAYTLGCFQRLSLSTGYYVFYAATTNSKLADIRKGIDIEIKEISNNLVSDEDLALAKNELTTAYMAGKQSNDFYSSNSAIDELYGLGYDNLYNYMESIKKVSAKDVKKAANKYFNLNKRGEVIIRSANK